MVLASIAGCIVVPVPPHSPDGEQQGIVRGRTIKRIEPGRSNREDILMTLGPPAKRISDDRFFVYDWKQTVAWVFMGGGYSGASAPIVTRHFLAIEFAPDGRVIRYANLSRWTQKAPDNELQAWIEQRNAGSATAEE